MLKESLREAESIYETCGFRLSEEIVAKDDVNFIVPVEELHHCRRLSKDQIRKALVNEEVVSQNGLQFIVA